MGKQMNGKPRVMEVPPLEDLPPVEQAESIEEPTDLEVAKPLVNATVSVPLATVSGYIATHVEVRFRHGEGHMAETLKRLHEGLYQSSAKMANGTHIKSPADAIRWLLEQVAAAG